MGIDLLDNDGHSKFRVGVGVCHTTAKKVMQMTRDLWLRFCDIRPSKLVFQRMSVIFQPRKPRCRFSGETGDWPGERLIGLMFPSPCVISKPHFRGSHSCCEGGGWGEKQYCTDIMIFEVSRRTYVNVVKRRMMRRQHFLLLSQNSLEAALFLPSV